VADEHQALLKENARTATFSTLLSGSRKWILLLREYRNQCTHFRAIDLSGGHKLEIKNGKKVLTIFPVLVPESIQRDKPTTGMPGAGRFLTAMHEFTGIAGIPPHANGPLSEDAKRLMEIMEPIQEGNGYIRVELFCEQHLEKLHQFVSSSFDEVLRGALL
jgi:hypothetical protein